MAYTTPIVWVAGQSASATELNKVQDNIRALKDPASTNVLIRGTGTNVTTTSLTNAVVDAQFTSLAVTTTGGALRLRLDATLQSNVVNNILFDVLIDGTNFASSMTGTPVTNGLWAPRAFVINVPFQVDLHHTIPSGVLAAGAHTFTLYWKVSAAATATMFLSTYTLQFLITE